MRLNNGSQSKWLSACTDDLTLTGPKLTGGCLSPVAQPCFGQHLPVSPAAAGQIEPAAAHCGKLQMQLGAVGGQDAHNFADGVQPCGSCLSKGHNHFVKMIQKTLLLLLLLLL